MPAQVRSWLDRLQGVIRQFSVAQRTIALIGVAGLVLGAVALTSWMSRPTLSPLFTNLSAADASAVVDELQSAGVSYQLANGGSTVLVPADQVDAQRIALASAGLPADTDGQGYSLLDQMPMTSSEFQQEKTYQRALEGELAKTIGAMDGVDSAVVRLAMPAETVFVAQKSDPTASVFVRTLPGKELSAQQVQAIVHLVSAGIEDMKPTDVAVVDATGKVLSAVGEGATEGLSGQQTADYEERVRSSVQRLLDSAVGAGRSVVSVTAELDYDDRESTVEEFSATPDTPPLASSTTTEEYTGTGNGGATGVLGPDNIAVPNGGEGQGTYSSTTEDVTNSVNKRTETVKQAPGAVERQSVAVMIDEEAAAGVDLQALQATIAAAAGIDTERGDTVALQAVAFDTSQADAAAEALAAADAQEREEQRTALIRQAAIAGAALVLVIVIVVVLARRAGRARREALDLGELPVLGPDGDDRLALEGVGDDELPELPASPVPTEPDPVTRKRAEITALADEQPGEVAELLRGWLTTGAGVRR